MRSAVATSGSVPRTPIPSEVILSLAGFFCAFTGMALPGVVAAATAGGLTGAPARETIVERAISAVLSGRMNRYAN